MRQSGRHGVEAGRSGPWPAPGTSSPADRLRSGRDPVGLNGADGAVNAWNHPAEATARPPSPVRSGRKEPVERGQSSNHDSVAWFLGVTSELTQRPLRPAPEHRLSADSLRSPSSSSGEAVAGRASSGLSSLIV